MTKTKTVSQRTQIDESAVFTPRFGADGLMPVAVTAAATGELLMLAYMNEEALARTLATGQAHYWSRSRNRLWRKGEESGNTQRVVEIRTDCDQDAIWLKVEMGGAEACCHTGRRSCFYRAVPLGEAAPEGLTLQFDESDLRADATQAHGHAGAAKRTLKTKA